MPQPSLWARIAHLIRPGRRPAHRPRSVHDTLPPLIPAPRPPSDSGQYAVVRKRHAR